MTDYDLVVPTIGRPSLDRLLESLELAGALAAARTVVLVDDRKCPDRPLSQRCDRVQVVAAGGRGPAAARNHGASLGTAGWIVFLDDDDAEACGRKIARRQKTRGAAADDDDVPTDGHQYLRPLDSHLPRKLIQNDNRIKRISSQNDCCRT